MPQLLALLHPQRVTRAVDVGCGTGSWLAVCRELGIESIRGFDGSYLDPELLEIGVDEFTVSDLGREIPDLGASDLALCLEVAEHLPASMASALVKALTCCAPVVAFSAGIPVQPGEHHINNQWPAYWADHFADHGFRAIDSLRLKLWSRADVRPWYAQNLLLYVAEDCLSGYPLLAEQVIPSGQAPLSLVHPAVYLAVADAPRGARQLAEEIPAALGRALRRRVGRERTSLAG